MISLSLYPFAPVKKSPVSCFPRNASERLSAIQYPTALASTPLLHGDTQLLIHLITGPSFFSTSLIRFVLTPRAG